MAFVSNDEINEIRAQADIVSIIGSYIQLTQRGKNYVCVCPFHEDHSPSMSVSAEKQIYKCFSCGAAGNVFNFVADYENVPYIEAVSIVANKCGRELSLSTYEKNVPVVHKEEFEIMELCQKFYQNNLRTSFGKEALAYLEKRGITEDIIKEFGIGLSLDQNDAILKVLTSKKYDTKKLIDMGLINVDSKGNLYDMFTKRITFPLWDKDGNIVGFSARIYRGEKDTSKYMNSKESKIFQKGETLYNYHNAKNVAKREKSIILVEGFMDAIRVAQIGLKNVVALQGTAMTYEQINLLKKLHAKVILCLDNDRAGLDATVSNGEELLKHDVEVFVIRLSGEKDPDEYILANGAEAFIQNVKEATTFFEFKMNYLKQNKDLNKVEDLTAYINSILKNLSESPDQILREVTLNKLSQEYNLGIDILKEKLNSFKPVEVKAIKKKEIQPKARKDAYTIGCEKILFFMMNGFEYIEEYKNKLSFFSDQVYREIANEIIYYFETNKKITVADFITYVTDKVSIKDKVMEIISSSESDEVTLEAMDDYICAVMKIATKNEIKRLKALMKNELDMNKKMKLIEQIAELKKEDV